MLIFIRRALSEQDNNPSTMSLTTLFIVLVILGGWLATTIKTWTMQSLSPEQVTLVLGSLAAKGAQRGMEGEAKV